MARDDDTTLSTETDATKKTTLEDYYHQLGQRVRQILAAPGDDRKHKVSRLGREFLRAAARGVPSTLAVYLDAGIPVNYQDPQTGETALHAAARTGARRAIRLLLASGECNFLIRDARGRFPSEMANLYGRDPALARLLGIKERKQADRLGIQLTRRPILAP